MVKRKSIKFLSVLLSVLMLASVMPSSVYAIAAEDIADGLRTDEIVSSTVSSEEASEASSEVYALGEDVSKRTENAKYIRMSDGSYYVAVYDSAVHYLDGDVWEEIDNTLASSSASGSDDVAGVATSKGKHTIKFANNSNSSKLVAIKQGNYKISFNLVGANKSKGITVTNPETHSDDATELERLTVVKKAVSSVVYEDILDGVDLEYVVNGNNLKENIIVKNKANAYIYQFDMKLNKLAAEQLDDGTIVLTDEKTDEVVYTITTPYMVDANGKYSDKVTYSLEQVKNKEYRITVTADSEWMNDESRVFPVTIDPPIKTDTDDIEDAYIMENVPDVNTGSEAIHDVSVIEGYNTYTLWKTNVLPVIPSGSVVTNATLTLCQYASSGNIGFPAVVVTAHEIAGSWSESTVTWNTFNHSTTLPTIDYQSVGVDDTQTSYSDYITWNITRVVKNWYLGADNNGIFLKVLEGSTDDAYVYLISNDYVTTDDIRPVLTVSYRGVIGLEDYYTYQSHSVGRGGTGYLNDYSSGLTFIHNDISEGSVSLPFTLSHIYNDGYAGSHFSYSNSGNVIYAANYSGMSTGLGWKLNIQESVITKIIGTQTFYIYTDSDGTPHYFYISGETAGTYIDEDGLGLILTVNSSYSGNYTITDKSDNKKVFIAGYLSEMSDANGNTVKLIYNSTDGLPTSVYNRIQSVVRYNAGYETTPETVATLAYTNNLLTSVTDRNGRVTYFLYSENYLTNIIAPDFTIVTFTYDTANGKLTSVYDGESNYGVKYSFFEDSNQSDHTWKFVRSVREYYLENSLEVFGKGIYSENVIGERNTYREFIDNGITGEVYDEIGTTYVFDHMGRSVNIITHDNDGKIYGASTGEYVNNSANPKQNNHIGKSMTIGAIQKNLFTNGGAEEGIATSWTASGTAAALSSVKAHSGDFSYAITSTSTLMLETTLSQTCYISDIGTYTASAYVDVSTLSFGTDGGVYLKVVSNNGTVVGNILNVNLTSDLAETWQRISVTFEVVASVTSYTVYLCMKGASGTVYFDDMQLEKGSAPSSYNMLPDGFSGWSLFGGATVLNEVPNTGIAKECIVLSSGGVAQNISVAQKNMITNIDSNTTFHLSAWAYATPTADASNRIFAIYAVLNYSDGLQEAFAIPFNTELRGEAQFVQGIITPSYTDLIIDDITLQVNYSNHLGVAYVYDIALIEDAARTYSYDSNGNLTAANQSDTSSISNTYNSLNNLVSQTQGDTIYSYTYYTDTANKHLLKTVTNDGVTMSYTYDSVGNPTGTVVCDTNGNLNLSASTSYINNGHLVGTSEDANGISLTYAYDSKNLLTDVTNERNVTVRHGYNENNDREVTSYISGIVSVNYNYLNGSLASIVRGGYVSGDSTKYSQTYSFEYDGFGNTTRILVGNYTLVTYEYEPQNGNLLKTTYGNGNYIENVYDELDRIVQIKINGVVKYNYNYNGDGALCEVEDIDKGITTCYNYDSLDRLVSTYEKRGTSVTSLSYYTYDDKSRVTRYDFALSGATGGTLDQTYSYTFDPEDNSLTRITISAENTYGDNIFYFYDSLKRLSQKYTLGQYKVFVQDYTYKTLSGTRTSTLIDSIDVTIQGSSILSYTYSYDTLGNITGIYKDGALVSSYWYDDQSQLTSEIDHINDRQYIYIYDTYGNIRYVYKYTYSTVSYLGMDTYGYTNTSWLDRLTSFNGASITYDAIGNPLSYNNGSAYTFTWQNGRDLASVVKGGVTTTYKYGADGQRIEKKYGSTTYNYYYVDGMLVRQTWGTHYIDFLYDESGSPYSLVYDGVQYYYVKNVQGDVVQIRSSYGTLLVEYTYDAWGNVLSITGSNASVLGANNPIRYRSYYYDFETGFYYLQSRYYDPAMRRFINADDVSLLGANADFASLNLYAYCGNNPVLRVDNGGEWWHIAVGALVGATISFVSSVASDISSKKEIDWAGAGISALFGAASGALSATGLGPAVQILGGAVLSGAENIISQGREDGFDNIDYAETVTQSVIGGITSIGNGISKGTAKHLNTQGSKATKQIFSQKGIINKLSEIKPAVKYYKSQTYNLFYSPLKKSINATAKKGTVKFISNLFTIGVQ